MSMSFDNHIYHELTDRSQAIKLFAHTVVVAQLVRALDCGSEGRGFESPLSPFPNPGFRCDFQGFFMQSVASRPLFP